MPKALVNGNNLHYWQVGQGSDFVMIHGLTGNLAIWHFTTVPIFRKQYRITTYDLRGHGKSDMPARGYTTKHMAEDLLGLMDTLEIEKAHLLGHSLGADIALHFAQLYPDRVNKIIAAEAGTAALVHLRQSADWPGWEGWARAIERYGGVKTPREKWNDVGYMLRQSLSVPIVFGPARGLPRKGERLLELLDTTTLVEDYQDSAGMTLETLSQLPHPVLLIYGDDSTYMGTYDALKDTLPNCIPVLVPGCEHFGILEKPDLLNQHIQNFLQGDLKPTKAQME